MSHKITYNWGFWAEWLLFKTSFELITYSKHCCTNQTVHSHLGYLARPILSTYRVTKTLSSVITLFTVIYHMARHRGLFFTRYSWILCELKANFSSPLIYLCDIKYNRKFRIELIWLVQVRQAIFCTVPTQNRDSVIKYGCPNLFTSIWYSILYKFIS